MNNQYKQQQQQQQGHDFVIKELLDFVEDAEELLLKRDREGLTALHIAIMASQPASFNVLFIFFPFFD